MVAWTLGTHCTHAVHVAAGFMQIIIIMMMDGCIDMLEEYVTLIPVAILVSVCVQLCARLCVYLKDMLP